MEEYSFPRREKRIVHQFKQKAGWQDTHHLVPRARGGEDIDSNRLLLDAYKHDAWHLIFKHLTLHEAIELLQRLERRKKDSSVSEILKNLFN